MTTIPAGQTDRSHKQEKNQQSMVKTLLPNAAVTPKKNSGEKRKLKNKLDCFYIMPAVTSFIRTKTFAKYLSTQKHKMLHSSLTMEG